MSMREMSIKKPENVEKEYVYIENIERRDVDKGWSGIGKHRKEKIERKKSIQGNADNDFQFY